MPTATMKLDRPVAKRIQRARAWTLFGANASDWVGAGGSASIIESIDSLN
jgi:hypothetical protein